MSDPFRHTLKPDTDARQADQVPVAVEYRALSSTWFNGQQPLASALAGRQLPSKPRLEFPRSRPKKTRTREDAVRELIRSNHGAQGGMARQLNKTYLLPVHGGSGAHMIKVR